MDFILLILLMIFFMLPFFGYAVFWYETCNSPYRESLERASEGKQALWVLRGIVSSLFCNALVMALLPLGFVSRLWRPGAETDPGGPAVILIHGLYHNAGAWVFYRRWLQKSGYDRVYAFSYGSWKSGFHEIYGRFESWMAQVRQECPDAPMVMVGHSLGGLLARDYAAKNKTEPEFPIQGVITLGTPFRGSKMTVFGLGPMAAGLQFESPLIGELASRKVPPDLHTAAIYSPVDNLVLPAESLHPPHGWTEDRTSPICHLAAIYHKPTFRRVLSHIETALSGP